MGEIQIHHPFELMRQVEKQDLTQKTEEKVNKLSSVLMLDFSGFYDKNDFWTYNICSK